MSSSSPPRASVSKLSCPQDPMSPQEEYGGFTRRGLCSGPTTIITHYQVLGPQLAESLFLNENVQASRLPSCPTSRRNLNIELYLFLLVALAAVLAVAHDTMLRIMKARQVDSSGFSIRNTSNALAIVISALPASKIPVALICSHQRCGTMVIHVEHKPHGTQLFHHRNLHRFPVSRRSSPTQSRNFLPVSSSPSSRAGVTAFVQVAVPAIVLDTKPEYFHEAYGVALGVTAFCAVMGLIYLFGQMV